jgi:hypothetical protein
MKAAIIIAVITVWITLLTLAIREERAERAKITPTPPPGFHLKLEETPPKIYFYNVLLPDGTKLVFKGTEIHGQGLCTEIMLNGRLDTRICNSHLITEAIGEIVPSPSPLPEKEM